MAWGYARYVGSLFVPGGIDVFCRFFGGLYAPKMELLMKVRSCGEWGTERAGIVS